MHLFLSTVLWHFLATCVLFDRGFGAVFKREIRGLWFTEANILHSFFLFSAESLSKSEDRKVVCHYRFVRDRNFSALQLRNQIVWYSVTEATFLCYSTFYVQYKQFQRCVSAVIRPAFLEIMSRCFSEAKATCRLPCFAFGLGRNSSPMEEWKLSGEGSPLALWMRGLFAAAYSCE